MAATNRDYDYLPRNDSEKVLTCRTVTTIYRTRNVSIYRGFKNSFLYRILNRYTKKLLCYTNLLIENETCSMAL